jgi:8-oxo-dGTP pyrophosphatase MutT (NUDIX family)
MPELEIEVEVPKAACVLIWRDDGRILGVSRPEDPEAFTLPGGGMHAGEEPADTAARELMEETGVGVSELTPVFHALSDGIPCTAFEGVPLPLEEFSPAKGEKGAVKWCTPSELAEGPFGEYNKLLFRGMGIPY